MTVACQGFWLRTCATAGIWATTRVSRTCRARTRVDSLRCSLRAAARVEGLTLEGYVIRAPRRDERVSIDTVLVPESAIVAHTATPIDDDRYPSYQHWLTLASVLGLGEDAIPPDEMRVLNRDGSSTRWWWAWWD